MSVKRILVFGTEGQLARSFRLYSPDAKFVQRSQCDFENPAQITAVLDQFKPNVVINPAAYTQVDLAEDESGRAFAINATAPQYIAEWCRRADASLIHYSTDYVYSGEGERSWKESDETHALNVYGASKLAGEHAIQKSGCHFYIFRTSWVFSPFGKNFLKTMFSLGQSREHLRVVGDQWGAPTSALDLARATLGVCAHPDFLKKSGVFNMTNSGTTSWHGFAEEIFKQMRRLEVSIAVKRLDSISSAEYPTRARRPKNSRLDGSRLKTEFSVTLRDWKEALEEDLIRLVSCTR